MGMYTGLRFSGVVKEKYRKDIEKISEGGTWKDCENSILIAFSNYNRSLMIPHGMLCYMPHEWEDPNALANAKYDFNGRINMDTGVWNFQCSLKNYENTIEYFLKNIAAEICEAVKYAEVLYEEDEYSTFYKFEPECEVINGKAVVVGNNVVVDPTRKIRYGYYEDEEPIEYDNKTFEENVKTKEEPVKKGFIQGLLSIIFSFM